MIIGQIFNGKYNNLDSDDSVWHFAILNKPFLLIIDLTK